MSQMLTFTTPVDAFDRTLLPEDARQPGTDEFRAAVKHYFNQQLGSLGGWREIRVSERSIDVRWTPMDLQLMPSNAPLKS